MKQWEPIHSIDAFTNVQGRKGAVTAIRVHPDTGALYVASSQGNVKLLLSEI